MPQSLDANARIADLLAQLYGPEPATYAAQQLAIQLANFRPFARRQNDSLDQTDVLLISYGNSLVRPDEKPLQTLAQFMAQALAGVFSGVHLLPCFPYSSDDGFSVVDFHAINPELGDWSHVRQLAEQGDLMLDLVLNHASRENLWFIDYISDSLPGRDFFIELPPDTDVSLVVRPRNTPLLQPVHTRRGVRHVWATFGEDQIDLNYANPDLLLAMVRVLLHYVEQGARFIRLDAVAFLWKTLGTPCIHLPQTHAVIRLLRAILQTLAPQVLLISETNVPHAENISYFGQGDEAALVYQFALPPLVLYSLNRGNASHLTEWARALAPPPPGCTFFNFTASHDGIGLRALEGLVPPHEVQALLDSMHACGGFVSMRAGPDGRDLPYEINISYFDALQGTRLGPDGWQLERFLCSQTLMLSLQGVPALYIHSLLATPNDRAGVEHTGRLRSINRRIWQWDALEKALAPGQMGRRVLDELSRRIRIRRQQPAFSPWAEQRVLDAGPALFCLLRQALGQRLLVICNMRDQEQSLDWQCLAGCAGDGEVRDLLTGQLVPNPLALAPYQCLWLVL